MDDLEKARAKRWWRTGRRVGSLKRAAAFVDDVGFALLFPKTGMALPSLWEAATDRTISYLGEEWGPDAERVWGWKDELPLRRLAWYGRFLRGRPSFLSPSLLADLYPRRGRLDDFEEADLSPDAHRIARTLLRSGPLSTGTLREALGVEGRRGGEAFTQAVTELGRELVVTHFGVEDEGAGWPSAILELTARAFPISRRRDPEAARLRAARTFLDTMVVAQPGELGNAFGWGATAARGAFQALVASGDAVREGNTYRPLGKRAAVTGPGGTASGRLGPSHRSGTRGST